MPLVDRLMERMWHVTKVLLMCPSEPFMYIRMEMTLVTFERQHIVGLPLDDSPCNLGLATHNMDGDNTTSHKQSLQQSRYSRDFVGFLSHPLLPKHQSIFTRPRTDQNQRTLS